MDKLKDTLNRISAQLRVLSASQRLVVALCAALVVVSVLWLLKWSVAPHRVPVLEQDFAFNMLSGAETALRANSIEYEILGQRIFVRAEDQNNAIRVLHESNAVPQDGRIDLDALIKDTNPFLPESERVFARTVAKGNKLAQIIKSSPQVYEAEVMLNPEQKRRIGAPPDLPTASVIVTLKPGVEMSSTMVQGFANMVSRAVAGLLPHNVSVIDGRTFQHHALPGPDEAAAVGLLDEIKRHESHLLAKVLETLRYIPNVLASVTVDLDTSKQRTEKQRYEKPEVMKEESSEETTTESQSPGEEGVYANVGAAVSAPASSGGSTQETRTTDFFDAKLTEKTIVEQTAPARKRVTASIKIPRSWVVGVYRVANPDRDKPSEQDLEPTSTQERDRVKASVAKTIMADPKDVEVDVYPDIDVNGTPVTAGLGAVSPAAAPANWTQRLQTYGPQGGLGLLAVVSLFMMFRLARKSAEASTSTTAAAEKPAGPLEDLIVEESAELVGTAGFSAEALEGKEVSPELLKNRNLVDQVSRMVEKDPHGSAELLRRWVEEKS